jgi:hypothetical protein
MDAIAFIIVHRANAFRCPDWRLGTKAVTNPCSKAPQAASAALDLPGASHILKRRSKRQESHEHTVTQSPD